MIIHTSLRSECHEQWRKIYSLLIVGKVISPEVYVISVDVWLFICRPHTKETVLDTRVVDQDPMWISRELDLNVGIIVPKMEPFQRLAGNISCPRCRVSVFL